MEFGIFLFNGEIRQRERAEFFYLRTTRLVAGWFGLTASCGLTAGDTNKARYYFSDKASFDEYTWVGQQSGFRLGQLESDLPKPLLAFSLI